MSSIMFVVSGENVFISLPDPKVHVRYCHHWTCVVVVGVLIFKLLHFNLLLLNHLDPNLEEMFIGWFPTKSWGFFVDQKYKKETRDPDVSTRVCPYIYRYKLFIAHLFLMTIFVMYSVKKSSFQIGHAICLLFYLKRGQKGTKIQKFHIPVFERYI